MFCCFFRTEISPLPSTHHHRPLHTPTSVYATATADILRQYHPSTTGFYWGKFPSFAAMSSLHTKPSSLGPAVTAATPLSLFTSPGLHSQLGLPAGVGAGGGGLTAPLLPPPGETSSLPSFSNNDMSSSAGSLEGRNISLSSLPNDLSLHSSSSSDDDEPLDIDVKN